jgi:hypothetical protein
MMITVSRDDARQWKTGENNSTAQEPFPERLRISGILPAYLARLI